MIRLACTLAFRLLVGLVILGSPGAAAQDCPGVEAAGRAAFAGNDAPGLEQALARAPRACAAEADVLRHLLAGLRFNQALALHQTGASADRQEAALRRVLEVLPLWQAHAALGDLATGRGDPAEATRQYQSALDSIASPSLTPTEPPLGVIEGLFRRAQTSRLLASDYVPTSRGTRGEPAGLAATAIRSFGVTQVALPIQFRFDSTEFTSTGLAAADDLAAYLRAQGDGPVTLIGHADPTGAAEYNRGLSLRRAEAVRDHLRARGLAGPITVEGRGHDEPFEPASAATLDRDQLHQLHRRVELRRH